MARMKWWVVMGLALPGLAGARAADWPQWRGPERTGIAVGEPSPTAVWGATGPPVAWQAPIPSARKRGGLGNPVIAGGRVFLLLSPQTTEDVPSRSFDDEALRAAGWFVEKDIPADLLAKVEKERVRPELNNLTAVKRAVWVEGWLKANLTPEQDEKFGRLAEARLKKGADALSLKTMAKLGDLKARTFATQEDLDGWLAEHGIAGAEATAVNKAAIKVRWLETDTVLALDAATGKELWRWEEPGAPHRWGLSGTPAVADGRLYVVNSKGEALCLAVADGRLIWRQAVGEASHASFLIADGLAVVPAKTLTALEAATGKIRWRADGVQTESCSPVLWRSGGTAYLLNNTDKGVHCVELATGHVRWLVSGGGNSTVAVADDVMAVMGWGTTTGFRAYRITPTGAEKMWQVDATDRGSGPVLANGCAYGFATGRVLCVNLAAGRVRWEQNLGGGDIAPLVLVGDRLLVSAGSERLALLDAAPGGTGAVLAKAKMKLPRAVSPSVAGGRMYLRTENELVCYELAAEKQAGP